MTSCEGCRHKVGDECHRHPPVVVRARYLDLAGSSDPTDGYWRPAEWGFPPALERCGEFQNVVAPRNPYLCATFGHLWEGTAVVKCVRCQGERVP